MRIVVDHVTRMSAPRICVAGLDVETHDHVRPTTSATDLITRRLLRDEGGPFGMGAVVDLGSVVPEGAAPETEDHRFSTENAEHVGDLEGTEFLNLLDDVRAPDLESAFGPSLERVGWKYAVEPGHGQNSLAVVRASRRPSLEIDRRYGRLQLQFHDPSPKTYLSVTDVRFYEPDHTTIRMDVVGDVSRRLGRGVDVYLMLGLARAYRGPSDDRERHWLQLNGVCLVDAPVGDVP
jgi:hypothetical protein